MYSKWKSAPDLRGTGSVGAAAMIYCRSFPTAAT